MTDATLAVVLSIDPFRDRGGSRCPRPFPRWTAPAPSSRRSATGCRPRGRPLRRGPHALQRDDRQAPGADRALHEPPTTSRPRSASRASTTSRIAVRGGGHNGGGLGSVDEGVVIDLSPLKAVVGRPCDADRTCRRRLRLGRGRRGDRAAQPRRPDGDHLLDRGRRAHARRRPRLPRAPARADDRQPALREDGARGRLTGDRERRREPRPLLGDPRRRRQLRRRHRVHVPGAPARDRRRRADVLGDRGRGRAPRGLSRVAALGAAQRDGLLQLPHDPAGEEAFPEELHLRKVCGVVWCIDATDEDAEKAMAPMLSVAEPLLHGVARMPIAALNGAFDGLYGPGDQWYWRGAFLREIPDEAIALNREWNERMPGFKAGSHFYPVDGAVNDVARRGHGVRLPRRDVVAGLHRLRSRSGVGVGGARLDDRLPRGDRPVHGGRVVRQLHDGRRGPGAGEGDLRGELPAARAGQGELRPGQRLPREPEHPAGGADRVVGERVGAAGAGPLRQARGRRAGRARPPPRGRPTAPREEERGHLGRPLGATETRAEIAVRRPKPTRGAGGEVLSAGRLARWPAASRGQAPG